MKKDAGGRELVPARYNARSVLGQEVAPDTAGPAAAWSSSD
jgi:hypothetical protein